MTDVSYSTWRHSRVVRTTCVEMVCHRQQEVTLLRRVNEAIGLVRGRKIAFAARVPPLGFLHEVVDVGIAHLVSEQKIVLRTSYDTAVLSVTGYRSQGCTTWETLCAEPASRRTEPIMRRDQNENIPELQLLLFETPHSTPAGEPDTPPHAISQDPGHDIHLTKKTDE